MIIVLLFFVFILFFIELESAEKNVTAMKQQSEGLAKEFDRVSTERNDLEVCMCILSLIRQTNPSYLIFYSVYIGITLLLSEEILTLFAKLNSTKP